MFWKLKNITTSHWFIFVSAVIFAFLISLPLVVFPFEVGREYQGIDIAHYGPDEHYYLAKAREIVDGNGLGNVVLREGKTGQDPYFSYIEYALVYPWKLLGLTEKINIVTIYNVYTFLWEVTLILAIYSFLFALTKDKRISTLTAIFVVAGYTAVTNHALFSSSFNIYLRFPFPLVGSFSFFLYLYLLVEANKNLKKWAIWAAGMVLGLSFYVYFYSWTFSLVATGVLLSVYFFKKDWPKVKRTALVMGLGLLVGVYNLVRIVEFFMSSDNSIISYTLRSQLSHQPIFNKMAFVTLVILLIFSWKHKRDESLVWWWSLVLSVWTILNQQIITGRTIQPEHYYWQFVIPVFIMVVSYVFWFYLSSNRVKILFFWGGMILLFVSVAGSRYLASFPDLEAKKYEQNFRPLIDTLIQDREAAVILAPDGLNGLLFSIYTKHDLFWNSIFAPQCHTPLSTFKDALFVYSYLNKESRNDFRGYYQEKMDSHDRAPYHQYIYSFIEGYQSGFDWEEYNKKFDADDKFLLEKRKSLLDQMVKEYDNATAQGSDIVPLLKKYEVEYVVWDRNKSPEWDLSFLQPLLTELVSANNIYLYRLDY